MGVHGLGRWVKHNSAILSTHSYFPNPEEIEPVALVIDFLAFVHYLSDSGHRDSIRGGNYSEYRLVIEQHVNYWRAVGLEPHFCFDGTFDASKLSTIQSRADKSILSGIDYMRASDASRSIPSTIRKASKLPPLTSDACIMALRSLDVALYFAEGEADSSTVELAQRLSGFAVSYDSDYFIFNSTSRGYIPLDSLSYGPANSKLWIALQTPDNAPSVSMTVYHPHLIARALSFPPKFLPLFASCLGNDLVDYSTELSSDGINPLVNGQYNLNELNRIAKNLSKGAEYLDRNTGKDPFRNIRTLIEALTHNRFSDAEVEIMLQDFFSSCQSYNLQAYNFPTSLFPLHPSIKKYQSIKQSECRQLYLESFRLGKIGRTLLQILKHKFIVPQILLELPDLSPITVVLGRPIRLFIYSLLDNIIGLGFEKIVTEHVRRQEVSLLIKVPVLDLKELLPSLSLEQTDLGIILRSPTQRLEILLAIFQSNDLSSHLEDSPLTPFLPLILSLRHIQRYNKIPWASSQLQSAILTSIFLIHFPTSSHPTTSTPYSTPPTKSLIHKSSELITCLFHISLLIETLLLKDEIIEAHLLFEGRLLHIFLEWEERGLEGFVKNMRGEHRGLMKEMMELVCNVG